MEYELLRQACANLGYRDKLRLAHYLLQTAIKEEEANQPRLAPTAAARSRADLGSEPLLEYVRQRLRKSRPARRKSLSNFLAAMFQFQGGLDPGETEQLIGLLAAEGFLRFDGDKVSYPSA